MNWGAHMLMHFIMFCMVCCLCYFCEVINVIFFLLVASLFLHGHFSIQVCLLKYLCPVYFL